MGTITLRTCDHCGVTEDVHENELGMGPLISLMIEIDPSEELMTYTGPPEEPAPALLCNEGFVEFIEAQPLWLRKMFEAHGSTHYKLSRWT
jgi:hypothetical protein